MKEIYVKGIVQDYDKSMNSINKYLFSENERLNAIIDDLQQIIDKALKMVSNEKYLYIERLEKIKDILGDKENE